MLINPIIPCLVGIIFFYAYLREGEKSDRERDNILQYFWFFIAMSFFISAFFMNTDLISTSTISNFTNSLPPYNSTSITTYTYSPDLILETIGYTLGIISACLFVFLAIRGIYNWFIKLKND